MNSSGRMLFSDDNRSCIAFATFAISGFSLGAGAGAGPVAGAGGAGGAPASAPRRSLSATTSSSVPVMFLPTVS